MDTIIMSPDSNIGIAKICICICGEVTTSTCMRCKSMGYCSRECQVKHWPVHKMQCIDSDPVGTAARNLEKKRANWVLCANQRISGNALIMAEHSY
jgi:hypothetical protein